MYRTRILALAAAALLAGCNGLTSEPVRTDVAYEADRQVYTPQDQIVTTLTNESDTDVGYNLCGATLELRTGGRWTPVARTPEHPCIQPLYRLGPGESATFREPASALPGPGTYRLRTRVETLDSGAARQVATEPFTLR